MTPTNANQADEDDRAAATALSAVVVRGEQNMLAESAATGSEGACAALKRRQDGRPRVIRVIAVSSAFVRRWRRATGYHRQRRAPRWQHLPASGHRSHQLGKLAPATPQPATVACIQRSSPPGSSGSSNGGYDPPTASDGDKLGGVLS
jgi:hypothetical protein